MSWTLRVLVCVAVACGLACDRAEPSSPPALARVETDFVRCQDAGRGTADLVALEVVARGLEVPWALDFAPDGRIFLTERPGRIRVLVDGVLQEHPWAELPVSATAEEGLMGIALAPDFAESGHVYVYATFEIERSDSRPALFWRRFSRRVWKTPVKPWRNRVIRFTEREGRGVDPVVLIDDVPAARHHAGGALEFGPDGMLYVSAGDAVDEYLAPELSSLAGKILRYRPDGEIPEDNPIAGSPIYAFGLRNSQGLAWHPTTGALLATEHGGLDELNEIRPGGDYAWPNRERTPGTTLPLLTLKGSSAPSGLAIYRGDLLPWTGDALAGGLASRRLWRVVFDTTPEGLELSCVEQLFPRQLGRIRGVTEGPDGHIYLTTSNRDGRGTPTDDDDRVLRVTRAPDR